MSHQHQQTESQSIHSSSSGRGAVRYMPLSVSPSEEPSSSQTLPREEDALTPEAPPPLSDQPSLQGHHPSQSSLAFIPGGRDGVFSNLSAKPSTAAAAADKSPDNEDDWGQPPPMSPGDRPPEYSDVLLQERPVGPAPPYAEETLVTTILENNGDLLIDGKS